MSLDSVIRKISNSKSSKIKLSFIDGNFDFINEICKNRKTDNIGVSLDFCDGANMGIDFYYDRDWTLQIG